MIQLHSDLDFKETQILHKRIILVSGAILLFTGIILSRLIYLQIYQNSHFMTLAHNNRIDFYPIEPVRGMIYDRNGEILARNVPVYNLEILPSKVKDMDRLLNEISKLVKLSDEDIHRFKHLLNTRPNFKKHTLITNLNDEEAARISVNQHLHSGMTLSAKLQRYYPMAEITAHVIGYVGRISSDDLSHIDPRLYRGLQYIGKSGIESYYEKKLVGQSGIEKVEINAHGQIVRVIEKIEPITGQSILLSLDIKLQQKSIEVLTGHEGAIVAIEPDTGSVLAFTSMPTYDPNPFVNGMSQVEYAQLSKSETRPFFNRVLDGRYAPGSTIKGFISLIGMENGISHDTEIFCPGWFHLPNQTNHRYRDWKKRGHGRVNGHTAMVESCDVYYYNLAYQLGIDLIHEGMKRFGFGQVSGIDLPGEESALVPSKLWKKKNRGLPWYPGETVITGIGQGYMLTTPLQLVSATAMLANHGKRMRLRLLSDIKDVHSDVTHKMKPEVLRKDNRKSDNDYNLIIGSMRDVIHGDHGTAHSISYGLKYEMAGKTGTSQVYSIPQNQIYQSQKIEKKLRDHSLFIGFAPIKEPKIAIAVVIEHGGSGNKVAAPIARKIIDYYLIERLGMYRSQ